MAASLLLSLAVDGTYQRMSPAAFAVVFTIGSVTIATASSGLVAVIAWYGAARVGLIAAAGGWSPNLLSRTTPLPLPLSVAAGFVALALVARTARLVRHHREVKSRRDAFAVDGTATTRRVVPTTGLLRELDPALSQAVIAHERSHLQHHHLLYRLAVETAVGVNPLLRPVRRTIDQALEAWAGDDAAHSTGRVTVATLHVARPGPVSPSSMQLARFKWGAADRLHTASPSP